jgi:Zn-dependent protease with chaperone function
MIAGHYYDGVSSRSVRVELLIHGGIAVISGEDLRRRVPIARLAISEPLEHAPRILRLPDGAVIESDDPMLEPLLIENGYRDSAAVRWQRHWPASLLALLALIAALLAAYQWGLPWAADAAARHLPAAIERHIGDESWRALDSAYFQPSQLGMERQEKVRADFAALRQPGDERTPYRIEFRASGIGANAFAMPNGVIVVTDDLVDLADDERALLGVLAHELGHLERKHAMRRLLQALGVGMLVNLAVGDVSTVLTAAPTILLDQKYSRDFEREADGYAIDMLHANHVPLTPMATLFEKMRDADGARAKATGDNAEQGGYDYLSSHPADDERIARLKAADTP